MAWRDTAARLALRSASAWRAAAVRFGLSSPSRWRDTAARFWFKSGVTALDAAARLRLQFSGYRNTGQRFGLASAVGYRLTGARLGLALGTIWRTTAARLRLQALRYRDTQARFRLRLGGPFYRDNALRFFLLVALWRLTTARFRIASQPRMRDTVGRHRLMALAYRHTGGRFNVRAPITVQTGGADTPVVLAFRPAVSAGDSFDNHERALLVVRNTSGGSVTVTVVAQRACNMGTKHNSVVGVADGTTTYIGPFDTTRFNDVNGRVQVSYSSVAGIAVAATRLVG